MKKVIGLVLVLIIVTIGIIYSLKIKVREYSNDNYSIKYDSTWKIDKDSNDLLLVHKKSKAILKVQCKVLDNNYIDSKLKDIIDDIVYSIEEQNQGATLIAKLDMVNSKYDSYSFLYEEGNDNILVNIYKKDNKVIIVSYSANVEYYDIVLDSVDTMLDSLEIITGIKVN